MLCSLGAPASSTTKTGHHDITERDIFTLVRHCFLYSSVLCYFISCASVQYLALGLTTHTSLSLIRHGLKPSCVHNKKGCTRLAAACDKVYQLLGHVRWFSLDTPASSTTKTGHHDIIAGILL